jgi:hypothetical protein
MATIDDCIFRHALTPRHAVAGVPIVGSVPGTFVTVTNDDPPPIRCDACLDSRVVWDGRNHVDCTCVVDGDRRAHPARCMCTETVPYPVDGDEGFRHRCTRCGQDHRIECSATDVKAGLAYDELHAAGHSLVGFTFGDLVAYYDREIAPRHRPRFTVERIDGPEEAR